MGPYSKLNLIEKYNNLSKQIEESIKIFKNLICSETWNKNTMYAFKLCVPEQINFLKRSKSVLDETVEDLKNCSVSEGTIDRVKCLLGVCRQEFLKFNSTWEQFKHNYDEDFYELEQAFFEMRTMTSYIEYLDETIESLKTYISPKDNKYNSLNVGSNNTGVQIQVNTNNSTQAVCNSQQLNYDEVLEVLDEIRGYFEIKQYEDTYKEKKELIKQIVDETTELTKVKGEPSIIKKSLKLLKDLTIGASGSLIASGIQELLKRVV